MTVLRENKDSLMTVLDALARDPLLVWGPAHGGAAGAGKGASELGDAGEGEGEALNIGRVNLQKKGKKEDEGISASERARQIIQRVESKLTGRDFDTVSNSNPGMCKSISAAMHFLVCARCMLCIQYYPCSLSFQLKHGLAHFFRSQTICSPSPSPLR